MDGIQDWANLLLRWFHVIAGIAWIGSSFYFVWLDSNLEAPTKSDAADAEGHLWMVHSGGFYRVEKKKLVPSTMPETLHWFKWEAGLTFLSGFTLLIVVYYLSGGVLLVDSSVSDISVNMARALGIGTLVIGWAVYDTLWVSPLSSNLRITNIISCIGLGFVAYGLSQVLSGRAAYMHVGAMMGTCMVANVWMRILPAQRALIAATTEGGTPDPKLAKRAKQRSMHNNYMTLPVVFVMISNHYYGTYGHELNWLVLILIMVAGAGAQHLRNQSEHGQKWSRAVIITVGVALCTLFVMTGNYGQGNDEVEETAVVTAQPKKKLEAKETSKTQVKQAVVADAKTSTATKPAHSKNAVGDGSIAGTVTFTGTPPKPQKVKLMPGCAPKPGSKITVTPVKVSGDSRLADVFVYIKEGAEKLPKEEVPEEPVIIDQMGCVYKPHVVGVRAKQEVHILNSDPTLHNVRTLSPKNKTAFNLAMPTQGMLVKKKFKKTGVMNRLKCDVHPWMSAFVGVMKHSYFRVTDSSGTFSLDGLPEGEYTIEAWHETLGTQSKTVRLGPSSQETLAFEFAQE
ncbi:MAG: urate hydroxylase PuuD [Myxococcota bacterium]|nr:urate hydroxylase PuuD [Myxococcota bacterium]